MVGRVTGSFHRWRPRMLFIHSNVSFRDLFLINYGTDDAMILIQNQQKGREKAQIGP